jgi:FkbM family methyltransferase
MTLSSLVKSAIPEHIKEKVKRDLGMPSVDRALYSMRSNGFHPSVVLDIGAYKGHWMTLCKQIWPKSSVLMIEASPERAEKLKRLALGRPDVAAKCALLGPSAKMETPFYEQDSSSSALPEAAKVNQPFTTLPMRTLDDLTRGTLFDRPDLIKLDVQGYEIEVLKGGTGALEFAEAVLIEVNLIPVYKGAPLLQDAVEFLAAAGFRAYDIASLIRRPLDGALWQADMVFVRNTSALISSAAYGA